MRWAFVIVLGLAVLAAILGMALVVNALIDVPTGYTVVMSNCGESFEMMGAHVASFADLAEAQEWADDMLTIRYDTAAIYALDAPYRLTEQLWMKSDSESCYVGQYRDWTRQGS
jgi:hypothetical protein